MHLRPSRGAVLFAVLLSVAAGVPAKAPAFETIEVDFTALCEGRARKAPALPAGWGVHLDPNDRDARAVCGPNGFGVTGAKLDSKVYLVLNATSANPLRTGRYVLTAAGAGPLVRVRNGFGERSFAAKSRVVNLEAETPIVNQLEFSWDAARQTHATLEVWGGGLQWLRLERMPDTRAPLTLDAPRATGGDAWSPGAGTRVVAGEAGRVSVQGPDGGAARLGRTFALPAGRYELAMHTRGAVDAALLTGPAGGSRHLTMDMAQRGPGDRDTPLVWRFNASGQPVTINLVAARPGQAFGMSDIRVTPVDDPEAAPSSAPRRDPRLRPSPWPARGMTAPTMAELLPRPARDWRGRECPRPRDRSDSLRNLKDWGADIARVGIATVSRATRADCRLVPDGAMLTPTTVEPEAFWRDAWPVILDEAEQAVRAAGAAGMKLVVLVEPPTPALALTERPAAWVNLRLRRDFLRGMRELGERLGPLRAHIWAYDLVNEPFETRRGIGNLPASQWRSLSIDLTAALRAGEDAAGVPDAERTWVVHEIGLFPNGDWAEAYGSLVPLPDPRVIYSDHYYEPFAFTHQNICVGKYPQGTLAYTGSPAQMKAAMKPLADFMARTGAPVYLGEFGAAGWAGWSRGPDGRWVPRRDASGRVVLDGVEWLGDLMQVLNDLGLSWTMHSYRQYYSWDTEVLPESGPCGPYRFHQRGDPDTPAMAVVKRYLRAPREAREAAVKP